MSRTFEVESYRKDIAGLDFRVVASDDREIRVMAESLNRQDADQLADAMNSLEQKWAVTA